MTYFFNHQKINFHICCFFFISCLTFFSVPPATGNEVPKPDPTCVCDPLCHTFAPTNNVPIQQGLNESATKGCSSLVRRPDCPCCEVCGGEVNSLCDPVIRPCSPGLSCDEKEFVCKENKGPMCKVSDVEEFDSSVRYPPGERYRKSDCSQSCVCQENGRFECQPLKCRRGLHIRGSSLTLAKPENSSGSVSSCEEKSSTNIHDECCVLLVCVSAFPSLTNLAKAVQRTSDPRTQNRDMIFNDINLPHESTVKVENLDKLDGSVIELVSHQQQGHVEFLQVTDSSIQIQFPDINGGNLMYVEEALFKSAMVSSQADNENFAADKHDLQEETSSLHSSTSIPWSNALILRGNKIFTLLDLKSDTLYRVRWKSTERGVYPDAMVATQAKGVKIPKVLASDIRHNSARLEFDAFGPPEARSFVAVHHLVTVEDGRRTPNSGNDDERKVVVSNKGGSNPRSVVLTDLKPFSTYVARIRNSFGQTTSPVQFSTRGGCYSAKHGVSYPIGLVRDKDDLGQNQNGLLPSTTAECSKNICECLSTGVLQCKERCEAPDLFRPGEHGNDKQGDGGDGVLCVETRVDDCCVSVHCSNITEDDVFNKIPDLEVSRTKKRRLVENIASSDPNHPCPDVTCGSEKPCLHEVFDGDLEASNASGSNCLCSEGTLNTTTLQVTCEGDVTRTSSSKHDLSTSNGGLIASSTSAQCQVDDKSYDVDEEWFEGCGHSCICSSSLEVACQPRCKEIIDVKVGCKVVADPFDSCCQVVECSDDPSSSAADTKPSESIDIDDGGCVFKNGTYGKGERFYDGCIQQCQCIGFGDVVCVSRCSPKTQPGPEQNCYTLKDASDPCCEITVCDDIKTKDELKLIDVEKKADSDVLPSENREFKGDTIDDIVASESSESRRRINVSDFGDSIKEVFNNQHEDVESRIVNRDQKSGDNESVNEIQSSSTSQLERQLVQTNFEGTQDLTTPDTPPVPDPFHTCIYKNTTYSEGQEFYDGCDNFCICAEASSSQASKFPHVLCDPIECPTYFGLDVVNPDCVQWSSSPEEREGREGFIGEPPSCCPPIPTCLSDGACEYQGVKFKNFDSIPANMSGCESRCYCENSVVDCRSACYEPEKEPPEFLFCGSTRQPKLLVSEEDRPCCLNWGCDDLSFSDESEDKSEIDDYLEYNFNGDVTAEHHDTQHKDDIGFNYGEVDDLSTIIDSFTFQDLEVEGVNGKNGSIGFLLKLYGMQEDVIDGRPGFFNVYYTDNLSADADINSWVHQKLHTKSGFLDFDADAYLNKWLTFHLWDLKPNTQYLVSGHIIVDQSEDGLENVLLSGPVTAAFTLDASNESMPMKEVDIDKEEIEIVEIDVSLSVQDVSPSSCLVTWRTFQTPDETQYIYGVQLRFTSIDGTVVNHLGRGTSSPTNSNLSNHEVDFSVIPQTSPFIHRDTNFYHLENLTPDTSYRVELYLIPVQGAKKELVVASNEAVEFSTLSPLEDRFKFNITLSLSSNPFHVNSVKDNTNPTDDQFNLIEGEEDHTGGLIRGGSSSEVETLTVTWSGVPWPEQQFINLYRILYGPISDRRLVGQSGSLSGVAIDSNTDIVKSVIRMVSEIGGKNQHVSKREPAILILKNLRPETLYQIWLEAYLKNGAIIESNVIKAKTSSPLVSVVDLPLASPVSENSQDEVGNHVHPTAKSISDDANAYFIGMIIASVIAGICLLALILLMTLYLRRTTTYKAIISGRNSDTNPPTKFPSKPNGGLSNYHQVTRSNGNVHTNGNYNSNRSGQMVVPMASMQQHDTSLLSNASTIQTSLSLSPQPSLLSTTGGPIRGHNRPSSEINSNGMELSENRNDRV